MALDQKKLQKKKQKKAAKDKNRKANQRKKGLVTGAVGKFAIKQALQAPVYECWEPMQLFDQGIGTVTIARKTYHNEILMAAFLLDVFCLGVKNCYIKLMQEEEYRAGLENISDHEELLAIDPGCARKLIEETEGYAKELGFSPHKDYQFARKIFGEIERDACSREFTFGKDGKPFYMAGPNDNEAFSRKVIDKLTKKLGPDGFHYVAYLDGPDSFLD